MESPKDLIRKITS